MASLLIDIAQINGFAESIKRFDWVFDTFEDPLLYPDRKTDLTLSANFFFFLVAIDHRTHPDEGTYEGIVNGTKLTGAELMYALAKRRLREDQAFFSPKSLCKVSVDEIINLFRVTEPRPMRIAGPEERTVLLRDCAEKLQSNFAGSILNAVSQSGGWLCREDGQGFLQQLKQFKAYEDPMNKKSFLLVKFLERRHFINIRDPGNLHVPVDNILLRLALRTGIVKLIDYDLDRKIRSNEAVSQEQERMLRQSTLEAFNKVALSINMNATYLDDILWEFGRAHCQVPKPFCSTLPGISYRRPYRMIRSGPIGECPFSQGCAGYERPEAWELKEPNFKTIYY